MFSNGAERSGEPGPNAAPRAARLFARTNFDKRIRRVVFPKSCFPSDRAGKCVRLQIEVCFEVLRRYSASQSDCRTEHTVPMLTVAWHHAPLLLLRPQTEKDEVMRLCFSSTTLIIHSLSSTGRGLLLHYSPYVSFSSLFLMKIKCSVF